MGNARFSMRAHVGGLLRVIALASLLVSCSQDPTQPAGTPAIDAAAGQDQPAADIPPATAPQAGTNAGTEGSSLPRMDGYGDMRFGMSVEEATRAWGGELDGDDPESPDGCMMRMPKSSSSPSFMFEGGKFVRYDIGSVKEAAPGGGALGMTAEQIEALYPGRVEVTPHKYLYEEGGKYLRIKDAEGSDSVLVFETDGQAVTSWRVGVPPQVDYVEGCS